MTTIKHKGNLDLFIHLNIGSHREKTGHKAVQCPPKHCTRIKVTISDLITLIFILMVEFIAVTKQHVICYIAYPF